jgi:tRNA dimethylallyltransferase
MRIGTAVPSEQDLQLIQHHFIHSHSIKQPLTVADYEKVAIDKIIQLFASHKVLILCGGSGLFIKAVINGLDEMPDANPIIRKKWEEELQNKSIEFLAQQLQLLDAEYAKEVDVKNPRRLIRALEVIESSGQTFTALRKNKQANRPFNSLHFSLELPRNELYERINKRVDEMVKEGLEKEAEALLPYKHYTALQTVGYTEFFDFFEGKNPREKAIELIKQHSRNYAKRQITWFKNSGNAQFISPNDLSKCIQLINQAL